MPHGSGHVGGNSGGKNSASAATLAVPERSRLIQSAGQDIWLRRPDRSDLGPVIDAQLEAEKDQNSDSRTILERAAQERLVAACVRVCARSEGLKDEAKPCLIEDDALALAIEASADEGVPLVDTGLARQSMALCRVLLPKVSAEVIRALRESRADG